MSNNIKVISQINNYQFEGDGYFQAATEEHFWIRGRFASWAKQIKAQNFPLSTAWKGLDIGCGNGVVGNQIEGHTSWIVDGTEVDMQGLLSNKSSRRGKFYLYDICEQNPQFKERYDFIVLFDVLEHIKDPHTFLQACLFHLKPGGYVFINVPALPSLFSAYDEIQGHERRYTVKHLVSDLEKGGLRVKDARYWGFLMVPIVFIRKILSPKGKKSATPDVYRKGFEPPGKFAHTILKVIMNLENAFDAKPFAGTSVMAVAQKK